MAAWWKVAVSLLLLVMPGGFLLALGYAFFKVLHAGWRTAQQRSPGQTVSLRAVMSEVHFRDVMRLARNH
jgi:hypothetical protein